MLKSGPKVPVVITYRVAIPHNCAQMGWSSATLGFLSIITALWFVVASRNTGARSDSGGVMHSDCQMLQQLEGRYSSTFTGHKSVHFLLRALQNHLRYLASHGAPADRSADPGDRDIGRVVVVAR